MFYEFVSEIWIILLELSPALLVGLLLAGLIHVVLPTGLVERALSRPGAGSTLKAVLAGVPMPLCSCGVLPTALGLKREGASNGATTGFLISTPQTGVDSILVSATFLGWPFALFKVIAAFVSGLIGGLVADRVVPNEPRPARDLAKPKPQGISRNIGEIFNYALFDLYAAIDSWIVLGVLIAALIGVVTPDDFFAQLEWSQGITGMLLMLAISTPLYICTTGSVPIAASFVAAGMPAGTAIVFLMAGPATNVATITAVYRALGGRILAVYLGTVTSLSILFGLGFDFLLQDSSAYHLHDHGHNWVDQASAVVLVLITVGLGVRRIVQRNEPQFSTMEKDMGLVLNVAGMTCQHCVANVKKSLEAADGVVTASPDLSSGEVLINGEGLDRASLENVVRDAGYEVK